MQGTVFNSLLKSSEDSDDEEQKKIGKKPNEKGSGSVFNKFQCMSIAKSETNKRGYSHEQNELFTTQQRSQARLTNHDIPELHKEMHGLWRQEQKSRAAKIEKQLKARHELEGLIEEQLNRFHAHYNQAMVPTHLEDVSKLLMPQWAASQELAAVFWLGDWRPSTILELLDGLAPLSFLSNSPDIQPAISQFLRDIRIEEAVIDEEMAEIQATCVLYLPFAPVNRNKADVSSSHGIQSMFKKIARVITKAQKLRFKALELVVNKVLDQTKAAEFLVAFSGIQDAIHQFAEDKRLQKGPVTVSVKSRDKVETSNSKKPNIHLEDRISHFLKPGDSSEHGQESEYALSEFEEQQGLRKGIVTQSVRFNVVDTSNHPMVPLEDRISLWDDLCNLLEQDRSGERDKHAINEFEDRQRSQVEPVRLPVESRNVIETPEQLEDRISLWEKFSRMVEEERSEESIQEEIECMYSEH